MYLLKRSTKQLNNLFKTLSKKSDLTNKDFKWLFRKRTTKFNLLTDNTTKLFEGKLRNSSHIAPASTSTKSTSVDCELIINHWLTKINNFNLTELWNSNSTNSDFLNLMKLTRILIFSLLTIEKEIVKILREN